MARIKSNTLASVYAKVPKGEQPRGESAQGFERINGAERHFWIRMDKDQTPHYED